MFHHNRTTALAGLVALVAAGTLVGSARAADRQSDIAVWQVLAAWGTPDTRFDLTGDGKVNIDDLLKVLASQPGAETAATAAEFLSAGSIELTGEVIEPDPIRIEAKHILAYWGSKSMQFDLDRDGVVGVGDLLLVLADTGSNPQIEVAQYAITSEEPSEYQDVQIWQVSSAWGRTDAPQFDLNDDGVVDIADLLIALGQHQSQCPGDCASGGDGVIDTTDLLRIFAEWGTPGDHQCDTNGDGRVDTADMLEVLGSYGICG